MAPDLYLPYFQGHFMVKTEIVGDRFVQGVSKL